MKKLYRYKYMDIYAWASSASMAWMLIRNKCHELNISVPTLDKIELA